MSQAALLAGNRSLILLPPTTIAAAVTGVVTTPEVSLHGMHSVMLQATFLYGAGGTSVKAYVQTSLDGGTTWLDIACFAFTTTAATKMHSIRVNTAVAPNLTPTDGTLADNTILDGLLGDRLRVKYTSLGTYSGLTSLAIYGATKG